MQVLGMAGPVVRAKGRTMRNFVFKLVVRHLCEAGIASSPSLVVGVKETSGRLGLLIL